MTSGFIDMALINSALGAVQEGKDVSLSDWHNQSLVELTYFLLHGGVHVVPGLTRSASAIGSYSYLVKAFPNLEFKTVHKNRAKQLTTAWLERNISLVIKAWDLAQESKDCQQWRECQRELFWVQHTEVYRALFDEEFIPQISQVTNWSRKDLKKVHSLSQDPVTVKNWNKRNLKDREARIADDGWMVGGMIRGKYHEHLAGAEGYI